MRDDDAAFRRAQIAYDNREAPFEDALCHHCERELEPDEEMHESLCPDCWEQAQRDYDDDVDRKVDAMRYGDDL